MDKKSKIPYDNKPKLITPKNAAGKGWMPSDASPPDGFSHHDGHGSSTIRPMDNK